MPTIPPPFAVSEADWYRRSYPFNVLPVVLTQQFAAPATRIGPPYFTFETAGAVAESAKRAEYTIERYDPVTFASIFAPNSSGPFDHPAAFGLSMFVEASAPANLDATAFAGIEFGSTTSEPVGLSPLNDGAVRLVQKLKDLTQWQLQLRPGGGIAGSNIDFTIPIFPDGLGLPPSRHRLELRWTPLGQEDPPGDNVLIQAIVDGQVRASTTWVNGFSIGTQINHLTTMNLIVWGGTVQTGACKIIAQYAGCQVLSHLLHTKWGGGV